MTKTTLTRLGVSQWSADTDTWPGRVGVNTELSTLNANAAKWGQGATASRPVAGTSGFYFWDTTTKRLWYDDGTTWTEVSPVGGGGTPSSVDIGDVGSEGASRIAARADHQHALAAPGTDPAASAYGGVTNRGVSTTPARSDHAHALPALPLSPIGSGPLVYGTAVGYVGTSQYVARQDHTHPLPSMVASAVPLNINGGAISGLDASKLRFASGHYVVQTNSNGDVTLATGFSTVCVWASYNSIDDNASGPVHLSEMPEYSNVTVISFRCRRLADASIIANLQIRISYLTLGY